MLRSSNEISRENCQLTDSPESSVKTAMRKVAHSMFQAPSANDQAECESETMVVGDSPKAVGRSQSLHRSRSDDRREPNRARAKGGRKVECEMTKDTKRRTKNYISVTVPLSAAIPAVELEERESTRETPAWENRCVWTDRMLNALAVGVRGGRWYALSDKGESELNLFTSARKVAGKDGAAGVDHQRFADFAEPSDRRIPTPARATTGEDVPPAAGSPSLDSRTGQFPGTTAWHPNGSRSGRTNGHSQRHRTDLRQPVTFDPCHRATTSYS